MKELIMQYMPFIVTGISILLPTLPLLITKTLNDQKIKKAFDKFKSIADVKTDVVNDLLNKVKDKEKDLTKVFQSIESALSKLPDLEVLITTVENVKSTLDTELEQLQSNSLDFAKIHNVEKMQKDLQKTILLVATEISKIKQKIGG